MKMGVAANLCIGGCWVVFKEIRVKYRSLDEIRLKLRSKMWFIRYLYSRRSVNKEWRVNIKSKQSLIYPLV